MMEGYRQEAPTFQDDDLLPTTGKLHQSVDPPIDCRLANIS